MPALLLLAPVWLLVSTLPAPRAIAVELARGAPAPALEVRLGDMGLALGPRLDAGFSPGSDAGFGLGAGAEFGVARPARGAGGPTPDIVRPALDATRWFRIDAPDSASAATALARLRADPTVGFAEWIAPRAPCALDHPPDDPLYLDHRQWGLDNSGDAPGNPGVAGADVRARAAWSRSVGANDLVLAIADTGIDPAHPDLAGAMPDGAPRIAAWNVTGIDPVDAVADSFGHGTTVVGVMAARTNDGAHFDSLGVAGVCGGDGQGNAGCHILSLKITPGSSGLADSWVIARAILAAAAAGARAVNVSFAGSGTSRLERLAMQQALAAGCVTVCAAGNRGTVAARQAQYPAAYAAEGLGIQVGACDALGQRVAFSSYGPGLDVIAPGVGIWTTFMTYPSHAGASYPGYVANSGTSLAAPFATGTVGLLAAARPELVDTDFQQILRRTARDTGAPGVDAETGAGLLDAGAALAAVASGVGVWHGMAAVQQLELLGADTLVATEDGVAILAEAFRATARVALPDSFAATPWAWAGVTGTTTLREGFRLRCLSPHAEATLVGRALTLTGALYRSRADTTRWFPVPPESARIAFTVLGRSTPPRPPRRLPPIDAAPNPFTDAAAIGAPPGVPVEILDVAGRRRRRLAATLEGQATWNGRDDEGRRVPPGVYFACVPGFTPVPLVRLE